MKRIPGSLWIAAALIVVSGCTGAVSPLPQEDQTQQILQPYIEQHGRYAYSIVDTNEDVVRYYWSVRVYSHTVEDVDYYYRSLMVSITRADPPRLVDENYYNSQAD